MDKLLTMREVASRLGTSVGGPRRLIADRHIAFVHSGRHLRIAETALAELRACRTSPS